MLKTFSTQRLAWRLTLFLMALVCNAHAQERPFVLMVNGKGDAATSGMNRVYQYLDSINAEVHTVPWNALFSANSWATYETQSPSDDGAFLRDGQNYIDKIPQERLVFLVGHSFGGDSLLKLAPRLSHKIDFLGVIDPVALGGLRHPSKWPEVPGNVGILYSRWQAHSPWPINFTDSGQLRIHASNTIVDQECQNIRRNSDGSPKTRPVTVLEDPVGYYQTPKKRYQLRTNHVAIATDDRVQFEIVEHMKTLWERNVAEYQAAQSSRNNQQEEAKSRPRWSVAEEISASQWALPGYADNNNPVIGGKDEFDNFTYPALVKCADSWMPGRIIKGQNYGIGCYGGQLLTSTEFAVLTSKTHNYGYQPWQGVIPDNAFTGGTDAKTGRTLFFARGKIAGRWVPGKWLAGSTHCWVPYDGKEQLCSEFELLCQSPK